MTDLDTTKMIYEDLKEVKKQTETQNAYFQTVLLDVVRNQTSTNSLLEVLSRDIKEGDKNTQKHLKSLEIKVEAIEKDVDVIKGKAKTRKIALYIFASSGLFVAGVIKFGNDLIDFTQKLLQIKGL